MPWMNRSARSPTNENTQFEHRPVKNDLSTQPPLPLGGDSVDPRSYRPVPLSTSDDSLPAIDPSVVTCSSLPSYRCIRKSSSHHYRHQLSGEPEPEPVPEGQPEVESEDRLLWLVIDGIVYDCTAFASEHPGGVAILEAFRGRECGWQFWRFHGAEELRRYGRPLRVGRTQGLRNMFAERPRFVGLRRLGGNIDEW